MVRAAPTAPPLMAAALAVAVAVAADVFAGGTAQHTATIGLVGVVVMALRLRLGSRHAGLFAAVTAAFLAQPVLHAAMKLTPAGRHPHGTAHATSHVLDEASTTAVQVLGAAIIVVAVACAEQLFATLAVVRPLLHWLCRPDLVPGPPVGPAPLAPAPITRISRWTHIDHAPRRGPPAASAVA